MRNLFRTTLRIIPLLLATNPLYAEIVDHHWTNETEVRKLNVPYAKTPPHPNDPYAPVAWILEGPYRGQAIDVDHERPALQLVSRDPRFIRVANINYKDEFWIADISVHGVQDVFMQQHDFGSPSPIAHSDALFQFFPGQEVHLTSQDRSKPVRHLTVPALETSADALGPPGVGFAFLADLKPRTALVIRVTGIETRAPVTSFLEISNPRDPTNPAFRYHLPIPDQRWRDHFLFHVIETSQENGLNVAYNLLHASCTTMILKLLDESLGGMPGYRKPWILDRIFNSLPRNLRTSLTLRNMYEGHPSNPTKDLRPTRPD